MTKMARLCSSIQGAKDCESRERGLGAGAEGIGARAKGMGAGCVTKKGGSWGGGGGQSGGQEGSEF